MRTARAGSAVVRIDPLRFLVKCHKRRLNQAPSVAVLVQFFLLCCCLLGLLLCIVCLSWYVFCLLVVLVKFLVIVK